MAEHAVTHRLDQRWSVSGARTTTASLGLVCDQAKSQVPALGYTVTYAVGNTILTIWGMILIMILS